MSGLSSETPITFACGDTRLLGVLHQPRQAATVGVVIVVGGPQYRVGSHRQFLLLARHLAASGIAVLRFDCRGMGDSDGEFPGFEKLQPDIAAAVDALSRAVPSLSQLALWGLCDAASSICSYAPTDPRIAGIVLLNPWVRSERGQARTYIKHYYLRRLIDPTLFAKILRGEFDIRAAATSLWRNLSQAFGKGAKPGAGETPEASLADRMALDLKRYRGAILLIISGRDLTAQEFDDASRSSALWRPLLAGRQITRRELAPADHTFSRREWRDQVSAWTAEWIGATIKSVPGAAAMRSIP